MALIVHATGENTSLAHRVSICDLLDRVLNKGAVLTGEIVISVADIELIYVGFSLLVSSVETLLASMRERHTGGQQTRETL